MAFPDATPSAPDDELDIESDTSQVEPASLPAAPTDDDRSDDVMRGDAMSEDEHRSVAMANPETDSSADTNALPPQSDDHLQVVVGIGGSAGSIRALQQFFLLMPPNTGMAFVVVLHLSPDHESHLPAILGSNSKMPVVQVQEPTKVQPNHVYVIPPSKHLTMSDGHIYLTDPDQPVGKRVAVDLFFRTLAASHRSKSVAVVLSGTDSDGAIGIKRIKEHGGVTVAQDPDDAEYNGMPRSAIDTGMVDWVLPVAQMPAKLVEFMENEQRIRLPVAELTPEVLQESVARREENALRELLGFLHARTGHDFAHYKRATILRRVARRLQVNSLDNIPDYLSFLRTHPGESGALLQDLLISVTNFFRDPDAFAALEAQIPTLFRGKRAGDAVRVWVPGCATGEEAYSVAILLCEYAATLDAPPTIQIFATDLDEQATRNARNGVYPAAIVADVSPERLRRFFVRDQGRYRVRKDVRDLILFASHNILHNSPFSRLDLVTCRNLLIYFGREAQERVFGLFHFALRPEGLLFLGSSESVDEVSGLFASLDKKHRIYTRRIVARLSLPLPSLLRLPNPPSVNASVTTPSITPPRFSPSAYGSSAQSSALLREYGVPSFGELHLQLLEQYAAPSVLINSNYTIVHLSEGSGRFLHFTGGDISINLLAVVNEALRLDLRTALFRAGQTGSVADARDLTLEIDGQPCLLDIHVQPTRTPEGGAASEDFLLVIFEEREIIEGEPDVSRAGQDASRAGQDASRELEAELEHSRDFLRSMVEQYETSTEELIVSNEELQSINEELRSTGEELETSKEELQAANEELLTVNQELKSTVDEVSRANADLQNLMSSTDIATIFLDRELRIKRFTPRAVDLFQLIPTDLGRPLSDLRHKLDYQDLAENADSVLETLHTFEHEVHTHDGQWFLFRVLPYRTQEDFISGVVLTFVDITRRKAAEDALHESKERYRMLIEGVRDYAVFSLALDTRVTSWNGGAEGLFGYREDEIVGQSASVLLQPADRDKSTLREMLATAAREGLVREEQWNARKDGTRFFAFGTVTSQRDDNGVVTGFVKVLRDMTEHKGAEEQLRESEARFRAIISQATTGIAQTDLQGTLTFVNQQYCDLLGYPEAELLGTRMQDKGHPDDRVSGEELLQRITGEGEPFHTEQRYIRKDGAIIWVSNTVTAIFDASGQPYAMIAVIVDMNERRHTEDALRESEQRLRVTVEAAQLGTTDWDYPAATLFWNAQHFRLFGMEPHSNPIPLDEFYARVHPEDRDWMRKELAQQIETRGAYNLECRIVRADNQEVRWMNKSGRVIESRDGHPLRLVGVTFDVTERRAADEMMRRTQDELEARVGERTRELETANAELQAQASERARAEKSRELLLRRLVSTQEEERRRISRELHDQTGQQLTALLMGLNALPALSDGGSNSPRSDQTVESLQRLTNDIMNRIHHLAWELRPAALDNLGLEAALRQYVEEWSRTTQVRADFVSHDINSAKRLAGTIESVLYRVVQEALTNVSRHAQASHVSVLLERIDSNVVVIVEDNGSSFDVEAKNQEGTTITGRLGLLGMRERVELVGGTLTLESAPDTGTTVYVRIPLNTPVE